MTGLLFSNEVVTQELPWVSTHGCGTCLPCFRRVDSAAKPPIAPEKDLKKCNHPVVDTTGIGCADPSGLKYADTRPPRRVVRPRIESGSEAATEVSEIEQADHSVTVHVQVALKVLFTGGQSEGAAECGKVE